MQQQLDLLGDQFLAPALAELRSQDQPLLLDADLTGRPVSDGSTSYPAAAFGYMDGQIRLGYQLAAVCLHTKRYGRQWLVGQQHPGDTVSAPTLLGLITETERRLGTHPRRRPELLAGRIAQAEAAATRYEMRASSQQAKADACLLREQHLLEQIAAAERQIYQLQRRRPVAATADSAAKQLRQQITARQARLGRIRRQWAVALGRAERAAAAALADRSLIPALAAYQAELAAENAACANLPRCIMRLDAGFSSGENLAMLLEMGYELETKASNAGLVRALRGQVSSATAWTRVGKNAEMVGWTNYRLKSCPYPLTVGLERFHTPAGHKYAVLLRYQAEAAAPCPDLAAWFHSYNGRGSIEAGIKQAKTVFHVQHLLSRGAIGMQMQVALTLFAANFVGWAGEWVEQRLLQPQARVRELLASVKRLVRQAANSPALVEAGGGQVLLRFSATSGFAGLIICLAGASSVQLELPLYSSSAAPWAGG